VRKTTDVGVVQTFLQTKSDATYFGIDDTQTVLYLKTHVSNSVNIEE
jgi:hypothetical protein